MHLECHAALGWLLANAGSADRRVRNYTVVCAILPDIDAIPYVFGAYYYGLLHHTFGHNVFVWLLCAFWGRYRYGAWRAALLGFLAFGSHLITDAYLSNWYLYLFWPLSAKGFLPSNSQELSAPINTYLLYSTPLVIIAAAFIWRCTPLEWISPRLDQLFFSFFQRKTGHCSSCSRGANISCDDCQRPICPRHMQVLRKWRVVCPECRKL